MSVRSLARMTRLTRRQRRLRLLDTATVTVLSLLSLPTKTMVFVHLPVRLAERFTLRLSLLRSTRLPKLSLLRLVRKRVTRFIPAMKMQRSPIRITGLSLLVTSGKSTRRMLLARVLVA